jgi:hypothetical protein
MTMFKKIALVLALAPVFVSGSAFAGPSKPKPIIGGPIVPGAPVILPGVEVSGHSASTAGWFTQSFTISTNASFYDAVNGTLNAFGQSTLFNSLSFKIVGDGSNVYNSALLPSGAVSASFVDAANIPFSLQAGHTYTINVLGNSKVANAVFTVSGSTGIATITPGPIAAVPEPESYAMLLAGLGLMGGIARRRSLNK